MKTLRGIKAARDAELAAKLEAEVDEAPEPEQSSPSDDMRQAAEQALTLLVEEAGAASVFVIAVTEDGALGMARTGNPAYLHAALQRATAINHREKLLEEIAAIDKALAK